MCFLTTCRYRPCKCIAWRKMTFCLARTINEEAECNKLYTQTEYCMVRKCIRHLDGPPPTRHISATSSHSAKSTLNSIPDSFKSDASANTVFSDIVVMPATPFGSCDKEDHHHTHFLPADFWFSDPRDPINIAILDLHIKTTCKGRHEAYVEKQRCAKEISRAERQLCGLSIVIPPETNGDPLPVLIENIRRQERESDQRAKQRLEQRRINIAPSCPTSEEMLSGPKIKDRNDVVLGTTLHRERGGFTTVCRQKWRGFEIENKDLSSKKIDDNIVWNWKFGHWVSSEKIDPEIPRR
ncbi:hypothetical protein B7494_g5322 [Chlorociboria aeruginascens]|nr:hypothetical protein B7494_g5322 [Chlorociboria aeruginascens]